MTVLSVTTGAPDPRDAALAARREAASRCASTTPARTARCCTTGACRCASTAGRARSRAPSSAWRGRRSRGRSAPAPRSLPARRWCSAAGPAAHRVRPRRRARARGRRRSPTARARPPAARPWGAIVAAVVALAGLAIALRLRRDAALELGALAVAAILLALPLVGRLPVLRHGVIVTTLDPDLVRALVVGGLAAAAGAIAAAARAWWPGVSQRRVGRLTRRRSASRARARRAARSRAGRGPRRGCRRPRRRRDRASRCAWKSRSIWAS